MTEQPDEIILDPPPPQEPDPGRWTPPDGNEVIVPDPPTPTPEPVVPEGG